MARYAGLHFEVVRRMVAVSQGASGSLPVRRTDSHGYPRVNSTRLNCRVHRKQNRQQERRRLFPRHHPGNRRRRGGRLAFQLFRGSRCHWSEHLQPGGGRVGCNLGSRGLSRDPARGVVRCGSFGRMPSRHSRACASVVDTVPLRFGIEPGYPQLIVSPMGLNLRFILSRLPSPLAQSAPQLCF
jgi:hypothetical protein